MTTLMAIMIMIMEIIMVIMAMGINVEKSALKKIAKASAKNSVDMICRTNVTKVMFTDNIKK